MEKQGHTLEQLCGRHKGAIRAIPKNTPGTHPHSAEQAEPQVLTVSTEAEKGMGTKQGTRPIPVKDTSFLLTPFKSISG